MKEDRFVRDGKLFYPSQYFFEKYANTVEFNGFTSDFIEHEYSNIDEEIAAIIRKVANDDHYSLTLHEWMMVQYFIGVIYWRCPCNFKYLKSYVGDAQSLHELGINIRNKETHHLGSGSVQDTWLKALKEDINFLKFMKLSLPAITYPEVFNRQGPDYAHITPFPYAHKLPKLVSDNPIIYRRPGIESLHRDEFIFKITHDKVLFRHRYMNPEIKSTIRVMIDVLYLMQAHDYVACTDMDYIKVLRNTYEGYGITIERLRKEIFDLIFPDGTIKALTLADLLS